MDNFPFSVNSYSISYGLSKLGQILLPLCGYIISQELIFRKNIHHHTQSLNYQTMILEKRFERVLGFMTWKIGCDLGFFLVSNYQGGWLRAFTFAGLIPYTIIQYFIYRLIYEKIFLGRILKLYIEKETLNLLVKRIHPIKKILSKYLHQELNTTSDAIPIPKLILKPFIDYASIVISWSFYTMGILFFQSGEINFSPFIYFPFGLMLSFYLGESFAYILGFNLSELIYLYLLSIENQLIILSEKFKVISIRLGRYDRNLYKFPSYWRELQYILNWRMRLFLDKYNLNARWAFSSVGGVIFTTLVTAIFVDVVTNFIENLYILFFQFAGQMNEIQVQQMLPINSNPQELPDFQNFINEFSKKIVNLNNEETL
ncbi:hypothetical protein [Nostoc parmelioides]|uniref:Uncharacterized protein n=1 Tax=Nostoc parmelioides FACHB-3921 TaxID=2692909 RepID=A0ABR8BEV8_9NOSO|nr:hypothetical protein [Nostoc parmelioides]MBD2251483.1 hypothetical protein [Nostoc parmelioides FACHB-3921]